MVIENLIELCLDVLLGEGIELSGPAFTLQLHQLQCFNLLSLRQKISKKHYSLTSCWVRKVPFSFVSQLDLENLSIFSVPDVNKNTSESNS